MCKILVAILLISNSTVKSLSLNEEETIIQTPEKKKKWVPLVMNIFLPPLSLVVGSTIGASIASEPVEEWLKYSWGFIPLSLTLTTIPSHIYVEDDMGKTLFLPLGKLLWTGGFLFSSFICALSGLCGIDRGECSHPPESLCVLLYFIGAIPTFGVYIWETVDAVSKVEEYNRKLEQKTFYLFPMVGKNGPMLGVRINF